MEDAEAKAKKRQMAAYQAKLTRSLKKNPKRYNNADENADDEATDLSGWKGFDRDGFLR